MKRGADSEVTEEQDPTPSSSQQWRRNLKCGIREFSRISMDGDNAVCRWLWRALARGWSTRHRYYVR